LWPEFNKNDFNQIIKKYKKIERTYGGLIWTSLK
jgi:undecaprenyl pyrophosphate synthase